MSVSYEIVIRKLKFVGTPYYLLIFCIWNHKICWDVIGNHMQRALKNAQIYPQPPLCVKPGSSQIFIFGLYIFFLLLLVEVLNVLEDNRKPYTWSLKNWSYLSPPPPRVKLGL